MEMFYVFGFIALFAAIFKINILYQVVTESPLTSALNLLILVLIAQNCFEFLGYFTYANDSVFSGYMVDGVLISIYALAAACVHLVMRVCQVGRANQVSSLFAAAAGLLVVLHASGLIVEGYTKLDYTIISMEGPLYPLFASYMLVAIGTCLVTLAVSVKSKVKEIKGRAKVTFIAIVPMCLVGAGVLIFRALGFDSSSALIMPFASTMFVWMLMIDERGDYLRFKLKWVILAKLALHSKDIKLTSWNSLIERMLIEEAMRVTHNNKSEAARILGLNKTTFHRKADRYAADSDNPALATASILLED